MVLAFVVALLIPMQTFEAFLQQTSTYNFSQERNWNKDPGETITYLINQAGTLDISGTSEFNAIRNAFVLWENDPGSYVDFTDGGTTSDPASLAETGSQDGKNVIKWETTAMIGEVSADLALTYTQVDSMNNIVEMDTGLDDDETWTLSDPAPSGQFNVQAVMSHEVGHWLNLGHTTESNLMMSPAHNGLLSLTSGDVAGVRYIYPNTYVAASSIGSESQDCDIAHGMVNSNAISDYVFAWADNPTGANSIKFSIGWDASSSTGSPTSWSTPSSISNIGDDTQGVGVALGQINNDVNDRPDLIIAWADNPTGANTIKYRIGWDLSTSGVPTNWSSDKTVSPSDIGDQSQGLGIALFDTPDASSGNELFVFWVDNPLGPNKIYYKTGSNIDSSGNISTWSSRVDAGLLPGDETEGLGVSYGSWIGGSEHDILVFWVDNPLGDNHGMYKVGKDINSTGLATWNSDKEVFPGDWQFVGTETQGAGVTALDVDSDSKLDASFVWIDNPAGANTANLRTEWAGRMGTDSHSSGGITVRAVEQSSGNEIYGLFANVYNTTTLIQSGYTPLFVPVDKDGTYYVDYSNYGNYYFTSSDTTTNYAIQNWGGGRVTIDLTNFAIVNGIYYNHANPGNYSKILYQSKFTNGTSFSGMYGGFKDANGNILSQGFTPYTAGMPVNQNLTTVWTNYGSTTYHHSNITTADSTFTEHSDNTYSWGGEQKIKLNTSKGNYTDTGYYVP